jgi:hypothetical protein
MSAPNKKTKKNMKPCPNCGTNIPSASKTCPEPECNKPVGPSASKVAVKAREKRAKEAAAKAAAKAATKAAKLAAKAAGKAARLTTGPDTWWWKDDKDSYSAYNPHNNVLLNTLAASGKFPIAGKIQIHGHYVLVYLVDRDRGIQLGHTLGRPIYRGQTIQKYVDETKNTLPEGSYPDKVGDVENIFQLRGLYFPDIKIAKKVYIPEPVQSVAVFSDSRAGPVFNNRDKNTEYSKWIVGTGTDLDGEYKFNGMYHNFPMWLKKCGCQRPKRSSSSSSSSSLNC